MNKMGNPCWVEPYTNDNLTDWISWHSVHEAGWGSVDFRLAGDRLMWISRLAGDRLMGGMGSAGENISSRQAKIIRRNDDVIGTIRRNGDFFLLREMHTVYDCLYLPAAANTCPCYWFLHDIIMVEFFLTTQKIIDEFHLFQKTS